MVNVCKFDSMPESYMRTNVQTFIICLFLGTAGTSTGADVAMWLAMWLCGYMCLSLQKVGSSALQNKELLSFRRHRASNSCNVAPSRCIDVPCTPLYICTLQSFCTQAGKSAVPPTSVSCLS